MKDGTARSNSQGGFSRSLVYGIGVNDVDCPIATIVDGKKTTCPFYRKWNNMLMRCYSSRYHVKKPAYIGCSVVPEWHLFSNFKNWMVVQDYKNKQLDKDLLVEGNKVYSPENCVFVDIPTNNFLLDRAANRNQYGVGTVRVGNKYKAQCSNNGTLISIGLYDSPLKSREAYLKYKLVLAYKLANQQTDDRVAIAILSRFISERRARLYVRNK